MSTYRGSEGEGDHYWGEKTNILGCSFKKSTKLSQKALKCPKLLYLDYSIWFMDQLSYLSCWKFKTLLTIISCGIVNTMPYQCLNILSTWRLTPRYSYLLLSALHTLLSSTPLEDTLLNNSLLFWELAFISGTCSRQFLSLDGITLRSHLNLMFLLLWKLWRLFMVLTIFQHYFLMLRWWLMH